MSNKIWEQQRTAENNNSKHDFCISQPLKLVHIMSNVDQGKDTILCEAAVATQLRISSGELLGE